MTRLHELTEAMLALDCELDACVQDDGTVAVPDDIMARHIAIVGQVESRIEAIADYIDELDIHAKTERAEYEAVKPILERFLRAAQAAENKARAVKDYVKYCIVAAGRDRIETASRVLVVTKNGGLVPVRVEPDAKIDKWPEEFVWVEFHADIDAIRQAVEENRELPPGVECMRGTHLRIRGRSNP